VNLGCQGGALNLISTIYPDHGHHGRLNVETKQILISLFNTLRQKPSSKIILTSQSEVEIILTTQSEGDTVTFLQDIAKVTLSYRFVTRDEQLTCSDLTASSQEKLLENAVNF